MTNFKNIIIANRDYNKIIFPDRSINIQQSSNIINKIFLVSDDLILNKKYKIVFDLNIGNFQSPNNINFSFDINNGTKTNANSIVTKSTEKIEYDIIFDKYNKEIYDAQGNEISLPNELNIFITNGNVNTNMTIQNIKLISQNNDPENQTDQLDQYKIYHYCHFNTPKNKNITTFQQGLKIRYILLRNIDVFKNKVVEIEQINDLNLDSNFKISDKSMFYCDEIYDKKDADKISRFCAHIKQNRYMLCYECPKHDSHKWKVDTNFLINNFDKIYSNYADLLKNNKCVWIPGYHFWFFNKENEIDTNDINESFNTKEFITCNPMHNCNDMRAHIIKKIGTIPEFKYYGRDSNMLNYFKNRSIIETMPRYNYDPTYPNGWLPLETHARSLSLGKRNVFKKFKFVVVCENTSIDGYITEKLIDCLTCKSLPIYFGPREVERFLPELFEQGMINGHRYFDNFDGLINLLKNMTEEEYNKRISKINSMANLLIDTFTEFTALNSLLRTAFMKWNIILRPSIGTLNIENINRKLNGRTIRLVNNISAYEMTSKKDSIFITNYRTGRHFKIDNTYIDPVNMETTIIYIRNPYCKWELCETQQLLVFRNADTNKYIKLNTTETRPVAPHSGYDDINVNLKYWSIMGDDKNLFFVNRQTKIYYMMEGKDITPEWIYPYNEDPLVGQEIERLIKLFDIKEIIETGTSIGNTTSGFAQIDPNIKVHSIEINKMKHEKALNNLSNLKNVQLHLGSSEKVLEKLLPTLDKTNKLFYLDAHGGEDTGNYWPELDEIKLINKYVKNNSIIVIDDFYVPNRPFGCDIYNGIINNLNYIKDQITDHIYYYNNRTLRIPWGGRGQIYIIPKQMLEKYKVNKFELLHYSNNEPYSNI